ncbi:MAG: hypothetical protein ACTHWA_11890 [Arachnia sp.]
MSHPDEDSQYGPRFERTDGADSRAEESTVPLYGSRPYGGGVPGQKAYGATPSPDEQTLPFVDLYGQSDPTRSGTHGRADQQWDSGSYGGGGQFPPHQYGQSRYEQQANPPYGQYSHSPHQQFEAGPRQSYGMAAPPPQQQTYGYYGYAPVEHPQSTTVLVLALLGLMQPITPFIAWYIGNRARADIRRGAPYAYTGSLKAGHITAKVLSILTILGTAGYTAFVILIIVAAMLF